MTFREPLLTFILAAPTLTLQAQVPPPTPKPSPDVVACIPANYDEAKVGPASRLLTMKRQSIQTLRDSLVKFSSIEGWRDILCLR